MHLKTALFCFAAEAPLLVVTGALINTNFVTEQQ